MTEVKILRELQDRYHCEIHSKYGIRTYCWIEVAEGGVKGGHREMSHREMTLWAQYIVSQPTGCDKGKELTISFQVQKLATKFFPPNIKQLNYPPMKKNRMAQTAPEFHIAVNLAPTPGVGVPALQGTCIVSNSRAKQPESASAPGPSRLEQVADFEEPGPRPLGHRVYISKARKMILQSLLNCANANRVPSSLDILTWMDAENPDLVRPYKDSHSEFEVFEVDDAFDIVENEVCHLGSYGDLGDDRAIELRQFTRDRVLIPLGLWETNVESFESGVGHVDVERVFKWQKNVEPGYVEDIEDVEDSKEAKMEEVEEVVGGECLDLSIEEIDSWKWKRYVSEEI